MLDHRPRLLRAAVGFTLVPNDERRLRLLRRWLDTWAGIGHVVAGMARQGYDLELRRDDRQAGARRSSPNSHAHSIVGGTAWKRRRGQQCSSWRGSP